MEHMGYTPIGPNFSSLFPATSHAQRAMASARHWCPIQRCWDQWHYCTGGTEPFRQMATLIFLHDPNQESQQTQEITWRHLLKYPRIHDEPHITNETRKGKEKGKTQNKTKQNHTGLRCFFFSVEGTHWPTLYRGAPLIGVSFASFRNYDCLCKK